eukprot:PhF_6_TR23256/c0_g1_i1/m.32665
MSYRHDPFNVIIIFIFFFSFQITTSSGSDSIFASYGALHFQSPHNHTSFGYNETITTQWSSTMTLDDWNNATTNNSAILFDASLMLVSSSSAVRTTLVRITNVSDFIALHRHSFNVSSPAVVAPGTYSLEWVPYWNTTHQFSPLFTIYEYFAHPSINFTSPALYASYDPTETIRPVYYAVGSSGTTTITFQNATLSMYYDVSDVRGEDVLCGNVYVVYPTWDAVAAGTFVGTTGQTCGCSVPTPTTTRSPNSAYYFEIGITYSNNMTFWFQSNRFFILWSDQNNIVMTSSQLVYPIPVVNINDVLTLAPYVPPYPILPLFNHVGVNITQLNTTVHSLSVYVDPVSRSYAVVITASLLYACRVEMFGNKSWDHPTTTDVIAATKLLSNNVPIPPGGSGKGDVSLTVPSFEVSHKIVFSDMGDVNAMFDISHTTKFTLIARGVVGSENGATDFSVVMDKDSTTSSVLSPKLFGNVSVVLTVNPTMQIAVSSLMRASLALSTQYTFVTSFMYPSYYSQTCGAVRSELSSNRTAAYVTMYSEYTFLETNEYIRRPSARGVLFATNVIASSVSPSTTTCATLIGTKSLLSSSFDATIPKTAPFTYLSVNALADVVRAALLSQTLKQIAITPNTFLIAKV